MHAVDYGSFAEAIELLPRLDLDGLLGDEAPLEAFAEAFARAGGAESRKVFLRP